MTPLVLIIGMIALPVVLMAMLRINAAIVFLSLCLGDVLVQFAGQDASSFINLFSSSKTVSSSTASLALLLLPAAFTLVVMIGTVRGHVRLLLNLLPAAAVGVLALLLAEPYFSAGLQSTVTTTQAWHNVQQLQVLIITTSAVVSLLFLWLQRPSRAGHEKSKGKHH